MLKDKKRWLALVALVVAEAVRMLGGDIGLCPPEDGVSAGTREGD